MSNEGCGCGCATEPVSSNEEACTCGCECCDTPAEESPTGA